MGQTATKHPMTIQLPHCWVCGGRFVDSKPPGPLNREEHHVIPRAAGGVDGPTVSLCDRHHTALHRTAECLQSGKPYHIYLQNDSSEAQRKVMWLAVRAFNAFAITRNDPNKQAMVLMTLDARQKHMVTQLQKVYPKARSREAIFQLALQVLYGRHFNDEVPE
jgi:hypothetical protein